MTEELTIQIEPELKRAILDKCQTASEQVDAVINRLIRKFVSEPKQASQEDDIEKFITEIASRINVSESEMLPCGLTAAQYLTLSDDEQQALWDAASSKLDETLEEEKEVKPDVITTRQRRNQKMRFSTYQEESRHPIKPGRD
jgi:DNA-directed RNA polymerase specialized sigma subunit